MMAERGYRAGFVAVLGRPNVGKSTLVNQLVGQKVSIVSRRPQTTRNRILGILTNESGQIVLVDSPGLHRSRSRPLNLALNRTARDAALDADVVLMVVEAGRWTAEDELALQLIRDQATPVIVALNKIDLVRPVRRLLPYIENMDARHRFEHIVPIAARRGENVNKLVPLITPLLPSSPRLFPPEQVTDQPLTMQIAETVREKLMERLWQELPYAFYVVVESLTRNEHLLDVKATIWVARASQKSIVVGRNGLTLKAIGIQARKELEAALQTKIMLRLWVRVRSRWNDDPRILRELGLGS